jgi:lysophospholipase L1-like esterase
MAQLTRKQARQQTITNEAAAKWSEYGGSASEPGDMPVVADSAARDALFPTPVGDEKVFRKDIKVIQRYDATRAAWFTETLGPLTDFGKLGTLPPAPAVQRVIGFAGPRPLDFTTGPFGRAACAIATVTSQAKTTNQVDYAISGQVFRLAASDNFWTLTGSVVAISSWQKYLLMVDGSGVATVQAGLASTVSAAAVTLPAPPAGKAIIGVLTVATNGATTFTPGTTLLGAAGITATFIDGLDAVQTAATTAVTAPTVTQGISGAASTIASGVFTGATINSSGTWIVNPNAPWRYANAASVFVLAQTFPSQKFTVPLIDPTYFGGLQTGGFSVEFEFDGQKFDFLLQGQPSPTQFRIWVDGQLVNTYGTVGPPSGGGLYYILVEFPSRGNRRIRIDMTNNTLWGGVTAGPNDTMWPPSSPLGPKVYFLGDSYVGGTGAISGLSAFWEMVSQGLGWRNVLTDGIGGTGYLKTNGANALKYRDRITTALIPYAPDIVVVTGGINDVGNFTAAALGAEASLLYAQIKASLPNCKLIVLGNVKLTGSPAQNDLDLRDALRTAATGVADVFIDPIVTTAAGANTLGWFTGTGKVSAPTGTGNADIYLSSDGVHPSQAGHDYLGRRLAQAIAAAMPF